MEIQITEPPIQPKKTRRFVKFYIVVLLVAISFFFGMQFGKTGQSLIPASLNFFETNRENAPKDVNWQLLWDTLDQINKKYVDKPADLQQVLYGAVAGAVAALGDPYTVFFPPKQAEEFQNQLSGKFEGIGAEIGIKNELLTVISPIDDSPALKAGIKAGDYIYKIDGTVTTGMTADDAVSKIRGAAGTQVKLTVYHKGSSKPVDITITRAAIVVKSVTSEIREVNGKKIGYLQMSRFGDDTKGLFDEAVSDYLVRNVNGIILDLRNNPGGYLETAVSLSSNWVKEGDTVVTQKFGDGNEDVFKSEGPSRLAGIPTVVLINGGSASASEILAGALHDHGLATLVGEKSFGKGSVQELIDLRNNASLKLTIAKWLTPNGLNISKEGIEPDVKVELTEDDFKNDRDPQLDKALEILGK